MSSSKRRHDNDRPVVNTLKSERRGWKGYFVENWIYCSAKINIAIFRTQCVAIRMHSHRIPWPFAQTFLQRILVICQREYCWVFFRVLFSRGCTVVLESIFRHHECVVVGYITRMRESHMTWMIDFFCWIRKPTQNPFLALPRRCFCFSMRFLHKRKGFSKWKSRIMAHEQLRSVPIWFSGDIIFSEIAHVKTLCCFSSYLWLY
jgi:hypothetical protein